MSKVFRTHVWAVFWSVSLTVIVTTARPSYAQQEAFSYTSRNGDGRLATRARLNGPEGLAIDRDGNLFIVESFSDRIRRVDARTKKITTVAGFDSPTALLFDKKGNVYAAETDGFVRRVDARTTEIAGAGGQAIDTGFLSPRNLAFDSEGNLFFLTGIDHLIRRVDAVTGKISTAVGGGDLLGDGGPAATAKLMFPMGIAFDKYDNMFIADYQNSRIRRVDARTKVITTVAGIGEEGFKGDGGPAIKASISYPGGVAVDNAGNLFFYEGSTDRVRRVDGRTGVITTIAGNRGKGFGGDGGPSYQSKLNNPSGIAVDAAGNIYIAEFVNNRVRRIDAMTGVITTVAGNGLPHRDDLIL